MREAVERVIYDNYDVWENYADSAKEFLFETNENENPSEEDLWDIVNMMAEDAWDEEKERLENFFNDGSTWLITGMVGTWHGNKSAGSTFSTFKEMWYKATHNCEHVKLFDKNSHLCLTCSHHDGTNYFEIKRLTECGKKYLERWESGYQNIGLKELYEKLETKGYSVLPNYAHQVFGCSKVEYKKQTA